MFILLFLIEIFVLNNQQAQNKLRERQHSADSLILLTNLINITN